jgi:hypothetical protein
MFKVFNNFSLFILTFPFSFFLVVAIRKLAVADVDGLAIMLVSFQGRLLSDVGGSKMIMTTFSV